MQSAFDWLDPASFRQPATLPTLTSAPVDVETSALPKLPLAVEAAVWRAKELGIASTSVVASGWPALDEELPGGGWPCRAVTEVLAPQPSVREWRLLSPTLRQVVAAGGQIVVVGPARHPHLPGLLHEGLDERKLIWIRAEAPSERMWVAEQLIRSNAAGAIVA